MPRSGRGYLPSIGACCAIWGPDHIYQTQCVHSGWTQSAEAGGTAVVASSALNIIVCDSTVRMRGVMAVRGPWSSAQQCRRYALRGLRHAVAVAAPHLLNIAASAFEVVTLVPTLQLVSTVSTGSEGHKLSAVGAHRASTVCTASRFAAAETCSRAHVVSEYQQNIKSFHGVAAAGSRARARAAHVCNETV